MTCVYCDHPLDEARARAAYDPWLGRLWRVCPECRRWNVVPLEDRWEAVERLERATRDLGRTLLRTDHLDLVRARGQQFIRVGRAPRPELANWRYSDLLPAGARRGLLAWLRRVLLDLPSSPFGYGAGYGEYGFDPTRERWLASPFLDDAPTLTAAFIQVPLADRCPSCGDPLALAPWSFQSLRLTPLAGGPELVGECGVCGARVAVPLSDARPTLRLGLSIVNRRYRDQALVEGAAGRVDRWDGPAGLLDRLARQESSLGELSLPDRLALGFALDEQSEAELLEAEWREAEEIATIVDRDLTEVEGFDAFRRRVLG
ncbi:MAG: hypothetical protein P8177_02340 [Gemmatimonadota bacterium]